MEERRRTRSQGPPTPIENNELIQWDPVQDVVRRERVRTGTNGLTGQTNVVNNARKNRTENSEISQEQHSDKTDHEQRPTFTPTTSEIPPKERLLENTGLQTGEIPPTEQRPRDIGSKPGEISPEKQKLEDPGVQLGEIPPKQQNDHLNSTSPKLGEIPQQKVHQPKANELTTTHPNREESPQMDTAEHYLDDNFSDVMRNSAIGSNVSSPFNTTAFNTTNNEHKVTLDWIIPDGRNSRLETLQEKHIMNFPAPGGKTGAMLVYLPDLEPFYNTKEFLIDLQSGELFAKLRNKWHPAGLTCRKHDFEVEQLMVLIQHASICLKNSLQRKENTEVLVLDPTKTQPPPLPFIPSTDNYIKHDKPMSPTMRKNYIKDRAQAAVTYITEYGNTRLWTMENLVPAHKLTQRLQIIFGKTNALKEVIDEAIGCDDEVRRKKCMRYLRPPKRFPAPEEMDREETAGWISWIHQETRALLEDLDEEIRLQNERDDPFTKNVIYATDTQYTNEISPEEYPQQTEDKLASPLVIDQMIPPLPQRIIHRNGEILPKTRELRSKPPVHNTRNTNTRRQITYDSVPWEGNDTSYLHLPSTRQQVGLEQFSMNDTTDIRLCHRCGGEGHIRKYCSINVHCDFCKSYSHHTSVCRSYANFVRAHPMASSRRTSPTHTTKQTDWVRAGTQEGKVEVLRQQKCEETNGEEEQPRRRDISEITRKHLERVISTMIPSSTCSTSDPTENVPTNSLATQWGDKEEKQVIVNNYYIKEQTGGWKQVKESEISPNTSRTRTQTKTSEISPNQTMLEVPMNESSRTLEENFTHIAKDVTAPRRTAPDNVIKEQQRFCVGDPERQNMAPLPPEYYKHPPPTKPEGNMETAAMLECIRQLQLTLKEHVLLNSKQAEYQMTQNADLFSEMIKGHTRRDLDPAMLAIPTFTGEEPEKCLDWINRIKNVCNQAGRSLRQELMNKSEPVVQNFIRTMGDTWTDEDVIDEILKYFSDIPTPAHAITKLRTLIQGEEEAIVTYNQKYRTLVERVEGKPVEKIDSYVELEQYLGSIILPIRKSIRSNIYWKSKHAPKTLGEAMKKAEELYMKHIYATGEIPTQRENTTSAEVTINEIDSLQRTQGYTYRRWRNRDNNEISPNQQKFQKQPWQTDKGSEISPNREEPQGRYRPSQKEENRQLPRGSYTQILVNPTQLSDTEFAAWMERLVEARKNRQENRPRPYSQFRKPFIQRRNENERPQHQELKQKLKPAEELNTEELTTHMRCEYADIEEAVDMYNLDVEECRSA